MLNSKIKSMLGNLWDKFWSGGIANPLTAIEQISYLLFMRRLDEMDLKQKADAEFTGGKYTSIFKGKFNLPNSKEKVDKNGAILNKWSLAKCFHMSKLKCSLF